MAKKIKEKNQEPSELSQKILSCACWRLTKLILFLLILGGGTVAILQEFPWWLQEILLEASSDMEPVSSFGELGEDNQILKNGNYLNVHSFKGRIGQPVIIDLISNDFDTYLFLLNSVGSSILYENDNGGEKQNAKIEVNLPYSGTYKVVITSAGSKQAGKYQLNVRSGSLMSKFLLNRARHLNYEGRGLSQLGRYDKAESLLQKSLAIRRKKMGLNHLEVIDSLDNLGNLRLFQGKHLEAENLFKTSLETRQKILPENHYDIAQSLYNLAGSYAGQDRDEEAKELLKKSQIIYEQVLPENHPHIAGNLNALAQSYFKLGRNEEAEEKFKEALSIYELNFWEDPISFAMSLHGLASLYSMQGLYIEAEPLFEQALFIFEEFLLPNDPHIATTLLSLSLLYGYQGRFDEAEPLLKRSMIIFEQVFPHDHPIQAVRLNYLASQSIDEGNYEKAEKFLFESLDIYEHHLPGDNPQTAASLNTLATLYLEQDRHEEAEAYLLRALSMYQKTLPESNPSTATILNNLAFLYLGQKRYLEAEDYISKSLANYERALSDSHPSLLTGLIIKAILHQHQNDIPRSLTSIRRSVDIEEEKLSLNLAVGPEAQKLAYAATTNGTDNFALSFHLQNANTNLEAAKIALTTLLRRKGRVLDVVTDARKRLRGNLNSDEIFLLEQYTKAQSQLASLLYQEAGSQNPEEYKNQVKIFREEVTRLEDTLSERSMMLRNEITLVEISTVQASMPANSALVELVHYYPVSLVAGYTESLGPSRYAAYILHNSGEFNWVDLGEASRIHDQIQDFLEKLRCGEQIGRPCYDAQTVQQSARALNELTMAKIRPLLGDATHLLLSPDGQLNLIPFAALVDEQGRYLAEHYTLTHLTSGRDLLRLQNTAPSQQPPVLLANPDYEIADESGASLVASASRGGGQRSVDLASIQVTPLTGTQVEVDAIAPLLKNPIILTEAQATENAVKQVQAPSILHIATHGFFLEDVEFVAPSRSGNPLDLSSRAKITLQTANRPETLSPSNLENPLLRSGLALAGFNARKSGDEDGVLTALEASSLNLHGTKLVVLSACETALGEVANGEGVYGLRRALVIAGAESQLMSLWKVSDQGTADLMQRYYQNLNQGMGRSEALRVVQLQLMEDPRYDHPYFWASFMFSGNWQPMPEE